jgi:hypothetical protein
MRKLLRFAVFVMASRLIKSEDDRKILIKRIERQKLPFTATIEYGKTRTWRQNRLQRLWLNEIAEQLGDVTPEEVRGLVKLKHGVPLLRAENPAFCAKYDRLIKPLPYEVKLEYMMEPLDFPITRLMKTDQKTRYLDSILKEYSEQGVVLTIPEERY